MSLLSLMCRAYRMSLWMYPADFRQSYGGEMTQMFRDRCRWAMRHGGLFPLLVHTSADLVKTAAEEHFAAPGEWRGAPRLLNGMLVSSIIYYSFGAMVAMEKPRMEADPSAIERAERNANRVAAQVVGLFGESDIVVLGGQPDSTPDLERADRIVRHPAFGANVGQVVVEWADPRFQRVLDRYLNGEDVPETDVIDVWTDASPGCRKCGQFLRRIRLANLRAPEDEQIRVITLRELHEKGGRALMLSSNGQAWRGTTVGQSPNTVTLLDRRFPGRVTTVVTLRGYGGAAPALLRLKMNATGNRDANEEIAQGGPLKIFPVGFLLKQAADAAVYGPAVNR